MFKLVLRWNQTHLFYCASSYSELGLQRRPKTHTHTQYKSMCIPSWLDFLFSFFDSNVVIDTNYDGPSPLNRHELSI